MRNCLIAQSGGPTTVINASVVGVFNENLRLKYYDNVYSGINGIEGILRGSIINLSEMPYDKINTFKYTPSSGLGSCRYKMKDFHEDSSEYEKLLKILDDMNIETFFYVGGNDSMDTVAKLSLYAKEHNSKTKFIGIPKTIDNDLNLTDHTPGFGSAAKLISTLTLETYLDSSVYTNNGIFILETMGRDAGWLASSAVLAQIDNKSVADFIYLPEVAFDIDTFLADVKTKFEEQNQVYIVVSEGIRNEAGQFISTLQKNVAHDKFGHTQLGGVASYLKELILDSGITNRVKHLELGVIQRCAMHCASETDIDESHAAGKAAIRFSIEGATGKMVSIKRVQNSPYITRCELVDITEVANKVKYFPKEWINEKHNNIKKEALEYLRPLILGNPSLEVKNGLPNYTILHK